jgi:hypothetical protein
MRVFLVLAMTLLTGCASVTTGSTQAVVVQTVDAAAVPLEANCELKNDKGTWSVATPGSTLIRQSYKELAVSCRSTTHAPAAITVLSKTKSMAYGNVLIGGLIGASIDMASGAAYEYPGIISVTMGPAVANPEGPVRKVVVNQSAITLGSMLTYRTTDLYTNVTRELTLRKEATDAPWRQSSLGDMSELEPPQGWLAKTTKEGHAWALDYEAQDGLPRSQLKLTAQALRRELVTTPAGQFSALLIEYRGTAMRSNGTVFNSHPVVLRLWVELATLYPLRFESDITGSFGSQGGRPSKERTELTRIEKAAQN